MSYAHAQSRPNPVAAIGALGVPAAFGALLVVGLAVNAVVTKEDKGLDGYQFPIPEIVEPPEPVEPTNDSATQTREPQQTYTPPPRPPSDINFKASATTPIGPIMPPPDLTVPVEPLGVPALPPALPRFDPVSAVPRSNPGRWITNDDYRTSWINRGLEGAAGFALRIDERGRVTDCSITRSTGHSVLDQATCRLLESRARFEPARDSDGMPVTGTYNSSVRWQIPE